MNDLLTQPLIQYGFAGFAFILVGVIVYMAKNWRTDMKEDRDILTGLVEKNTEAFTENKGSVNGLKESIKENTEVLRKINGRK